MAKGIRTVGYQGLMTEASSNNDLNERPFVYMEQVTLCLMRGLTPNSVPLHVYGVQVVFVLFSATTKKKNNRQK